MDLKDKTVQMMESVNALKDFQVTNVTNVLVTVVVMKMTMNASLMNLKEN